MATWITHMMVAVVDRVTERIKVIGEKYESTVADPCHPV